MWLTSQRAKYRDGKLTAGQITALEELGIDWDPKGREWARCLAEAAAFHATHGHLNVPKGYRTASGMDLPQWVQERRAAYSAGKLAPDRTAALEALGIVWDPHVQDWRDSLADCQDFHAEHGHLDIRGKAPGKRIKALGAWIGRRRAEYRDGTLASDRVAALEACGMQWNSSRDQSRKRAERELRAFHAEHGHANVSSAHVTASGFRLGVWMDNKKRTASRGGQIHPDSLALLIEFGVPWAVGLSRENPRTYGI